ncbi:MAG: ABC transporter ATP-binding protein [Ignavibacteriales bacterium]|nr:ABC transporter ATP-binding protein [Ignavibacteriales bacterium]
MIVIKDLCKSYKKDGTEEIKAVDNVNLEIRQGEFTAIVGPSGSGKSTLMNIIGLLDIPDSGSYSIDGKIVSDLSVDELAEIRNKKIGFVFQQFHLLPKTTAKENVEIPLIYSDKKDISGLAADALTRVGLSDRINHIPSELSGGQQQRVAIARALVNNPEIILADEPTGNLDSKSGAEIIEVFKNLNRQGKTIILITHDQKIAEHADRILKIVDGKITEEIFADHSTNNTGQTQLLNSQNSEEGQLVRSQQVSTKFKNSFWRK